MSGVPPLTTYLVKQVESAIRARLDTALRRHGVTTVQYTALTVLQHRGDLSSAQLARRSFVRPQTMHELVVGLERQGLLERRPSADRRHVLLARLTPAGLTKLGECRADIDLIEREMVADLSCAEVATLRSLLDRCHQTLARTLGSPETDRPETGEHAVGSSGTDRPETGERAVGGAGTGRRTAGGADAGEAVRSPAAR